MGRKRKQLSPAQPSRKRARGLQASPPAQPPHPHGKVDLERFYTVRSIIDERHGQYRIDWEDDPVTGEKFKPTWEPRTNATKLVVDDWKHQKAAKARQVQQTGQAQTLPPAPSTPFAQPAKRSRGRPRKVIDSSPEVSPKDSRARLKQQSEPKQPAESHVQRQATKDPEAEPEIVESQNAEESADVADSPLFEPVVEPSDPPSSYVAGEYQNFLSSSSQAVLASDAVLPAAASGEQSQSVPVNFGEGLTKVIPDSQTLIDFTSSAPAAISSSRSEVRASSPVGEAVAETPAGIISGSAPLATAEDQPSPVQRRPSDSLGNLAEFPGEVTQLREDNVANQSAPAQEPSAVPEQVQGVTPVTTETLYVDAVEPLATNETATRTDSPDTVLRDTCPRDPSAPSSASAELSPTRAQGEASTSIYTATGIGEDSQNLQFDTINQGGDPSEPRPRRSEDAAEPSAPQATPQTNGCQPEGTALHQAPTSFQRPPPSTATTNQSSFPFYTQIPRRGSAERLHTSTHTGSPIRLFSTLGERASSQPPGESSPRYSSPMASVPPYSIGTVGESAPPRPAAPSSALSIGSAPPRSVRAMDTSQASSDSKASLSAKLKAIREQRKTPRLARVPTDAPVQDSKPSAASSQASAILLSQPPKLVSSLVAEEQSRRSPSAVPAMEPPPVITLEEMNTSERYKTLLPQAQADSSQRTGSLSAAPLSRQPSKTRDPQLPHSYVVPIPLLGHQRDQYWATSRNDDKLIDLFRATSMPVAQLVREAEQFVEQKRQVALHPDLVNAETMTQYEVRPEQEAQWYVDCSAKFRFLKELLNGLRDQTLQLAVVTQPGRMLDMLDTFLCGITVPHRRMHDVASTSLAGEDQGLMVTLVSVDDEVHEIQPSPADLVIAIEPFVGAECPPIRALKNGERQAPLATLVVPYSIEHLEQSISTALPKHTFLRTLVSGFHHYRDEASRLEDGHLSLATAAKALADYLAAQDTGREWPLATLAPLENLDSQTESDIEPPATLDEQALSAATGNKRPLDVADDTAVEAGISKKARVEPAVSEVGMPDLPATINPQDIEITHISDSVSQATQTVTRDTKISPGLVLSDAEQSLRRMLQETQSRLEEYVQSLGQVQYQNEQQRQQLVVATRSCDAANATAQMYLERMNKVQSKLFTLKAEHMDLKQQLVEAKARLLDHAVPERAELESVRLKAEQAQHEKAQLETRLERLNKDHEYLRATYQTSSQGAQSLASQVTDLENSLAVAQNKATGEHVRLRQMGYDAQTKSLRVENKKLKAMLSHREAALKVRDEEIARLKEASRGRMGTRAASVPRSPRLESPMKMGDGATRGRGSRQGSPAAGDLRGKAAAHLHPLRNC